MSVIKSIVKLIVSLSLATIVISIPIGFVILVSEYPLIAWIVVGITLIGFLTYLIYAVLFGKYMT